MSPAQKKTKSKPDLNSIDKDLPAGRQGLTTKEAKKRLAQFGRNELARRRPPSQLKLLLSQFKSPLVYILVFAAAVTAFLGQFLDTAVIALAVAVNTALGYYQERKANQALLALRRFLTPQARVIRDGQQVLIDARDVVPGDVIVLGMGDKVPADGSLLEANHLSVSEAILTGEAAAVSKKAAEVRKGEAEERQMPPLEEMEEGEKEEFVFQGTSVLAGRGKMLVVATGMSTEMGKIATGVLDIEEGKTPLQHQVSALARWLAIVVGAATLTLFVGGFLIGEDAVTMFTTAVAVAVAAIPEGLVVTLTAILAIGMQRILSRRALVRKLVAAETLGSVSVVCVDKTGTLTEGRMRVTRADFVDEKAGPEAVVLCNDLLDPLEVAAWDWAKGQKDFPDPERILEQNPRLDEIPFSPEEKFIATLHPDRVLVSGAPEQLLAWSNLTERQKARWQEKFDDLAAQGFRLVGYAYRPPRKGEKQLRPASVKRDLTWLGILAFEDPVRPGVRDALIAAHAAGVAVKVITGDYRVTAEKVMEGLGFPITDSSQAMEGEELARISSEELARKVGEVRLFARVSPSQKLKIVEALKASGEVVAMTGDGVNDAPALSTADIGLVVGEASEVAKETADIVLLDSNFATITAAIEEGRVIFENIRKVVLYLLSDSFTEIILIGGALLLGKPLPILAAQILWVNLVEDGLPSVALAFEPGEKEAMGEPPRRRQESIINLEIKAIILLIGLVTSLGLLALFVYLFQLGMDLHHLRSIIFVALGIDSLYFVFAARSLRRNIWHKDPLSNPFLLVAVLVGIALILAALYLPPLQTLLRTEPLTAFEWGIIFALGVAKITAIEATKWVFIVRGKGKDRARS